MLFRLSFPCCSGLNRPTLVVVYRNLVLHWQIVNCAAANPIETCKTPQILVPTHDSKPCNLSDLSNQKRGMVGLCPALWHAQRHTDGYVRQRILQHLSRGGRSEWEHCFQKAGFRLLSQAKMIDPTQRNALEVGTPGMKVWEEFVLFDTSDFWNLEPWQAMTVSIKLAGLVSLCEGQRCRFPRSMYLITLMILNDSCCFLSLSGFGMLSSLFWRSVKVCQSWLCCKRICRQHGNERSPWEMEGEVGWPPIRSSAPWAVELFASSSDLLLLMLVRKIWLLWAHLPPK